MKSKITIMKKPEISDEEIRSYMDFDRILIQNQKLNDQARNSFLTKIMFGSSVVIVGVLVSMWFFEKPKGEDRSPITIGKTQSAISARPDSNQVEQAEGVDKKADVKTEASETTEKISKPAIALQKNATLKKENVEMPVVKEEEQSVEASQPVYVQAEPVDGYPTLYNYFSSELKYPGTMMKDSIQGVVMVVFTINAKGEAEKISIDQSLGRAFDDEAIRLIKNMPSWKAATYNKKPVPSRISLPITFQIRKLKLEE